MLGREGNLGKSTPEPWERASADSVELDYGFACDSVEALTQRQAGIGARYRAGVAGVRDLLLDWGIAMITVNNMRQHVEHLLSEVRETILSSPSRLQLHWIANRNEVAAIADDGTINLWMPFVQTPEDYGICLYGLARLYDRQKGTANIDEVSRERALWIWAREVALVWTPDMELGAQAFLKNQLDHSGNAAAAQQALDVTRHKLDQDVAVTLAPLELGIFEAQPGAFAVLSRDGLLTEREAGIVGFAYGVVYELVEAGRLRILEDGDGRWYVQLAQS
jgi:hypothetical protein